MLPVSHPQREISPRLAKACVAGRKPSPAVMPMPNHGVIQDRMSWAGAEPSQKAEFVARVAAARQRLQPSATQAQQKAPDNCLPSPPDAPFPGHGTIQERMKWKRDSTKAAESAARIAAARERMQRKPGVRVTSVMHGEGETEVFEAPNTDKTSFGGHTVVPGSHSYWIGQLEDQLGEPIEAPRLGVFR
jgi:hypothetical protein